MIKFLLRLLDLQAKIEKALFGYDQKTPPQVTYLDRIVHAEPVCIPSRHPITGTPAREQEAVVYDVTGEFARLKYAPKGGKNGG